MEKLTKKEIDNIRANPNAVNWGFISEYYELSEDFICEFQEFVDWECISKYQKLSEDFMLEFKDRLEK